MCMKSRNAPRFKCGNEWDTTDILVPAWVSANHIKAIKIPNVLPDLAPPSWQMYRRAESMKALMVAFMGLVASIWIVLLCAKIYSDAGFVDGYFSL